METPSPEPSPEPSEEPSPTYKHDQWYGLEHFICLLCGHEDWSEPTLAQHMAVYHQGVMVAAPPGYEPPAPPEPDTVAGAASGVAAEEESTDPAAEAPPPDAEVPTEETPS